MFSHKITQYQILAIFSFLQYVHKNKNCRHLAMTATVCTQHGVDTAGENTPVFSRLSWSSTETLSVGALDASKCVLFLINTLRTKEMSSSSFWGISSTGKVRLFQWFEEWSLTMLLPDMIPTLWHRLSCLFLHTPLTNTQLMLSTNPNLPMRRKLADQLSNIIYPYLYQLQLYF